MSRNTFTLAIAMAISAALAAPAPSHAAGIPVIDVSNLIQAIQQYQQMVQQLQQLQAQLEQAKRHYAAVTGQRGMGAQLLPEHYTQTVPRHWRDTLAAMQGDATGPIGATAKAIADHASQLDQPHFQRVLEEVTTAMRASLDNTAAAQALNAQVYDNAGNRFQRLQQLMGQIDQAQDLKAISDLQARLQAENGLLMNELIKLQAMNAMVAKQDSLRESEAIQSSFRLRAGGY